MWSAFDFCSVNANASICVNNKDVLGKYIIYAGHYDCFGDNAIKTGLISTLILYVFSEFFLS